MTGKGHNAADRRYPDLSGVKTRVPTQFGEDGLL
jgi:hypothetical protein